MFSLSVNKINFDHPIYELQDNHKVFKDIKLKTFTTKMCQIYIVCVTIFGEGLLLQPN